MSNDEVKKYRVSELARELVEDFAFKKQVRTFALPDGAVIGIYALEGFSFVPIEAEAEKWLYKKWEEYFEQGHVLPSFRSLREEFFAQLKARTLHVLQNEPLSIAFKNCVFNWYKFLFQDKPVHESVEDNVEQPVFHSIDYDLMYNLVPEDGVEELAKKLCPKALETFKQWVGDKWILLFEIIGYCLYPSYDLHKAIMLIGQGRNGKSTFLRLIRDILGERNVVSIPLQHLVNNRFMISRLYHKLANIYADLPTEVLKDTGIFKILTGEDTITADRKFRDAITFTNYAKLVFSANELPMVYDYSEAFWRRWILIEFPNQFPINPGFYEETFTKEEKEGVIYVSILAFKEVWKRGKFSFEGTEEDYREMWLMRSDSVYAFLKESINEGIIAENKDGMAKSSDLYSLYVQYCDENDRKAVSKQIFSLRLQELGYERKRIRGSTYYKGLEIRGKVEGEEYEIDFSKFL